MTFMVISAPSPTKFLRFISQTAVVTSRPQFDVIMAHKRAPMTSRLPCIIMILWQVQFFDIGTYTVQAAKIIEIPGENSAVVLQTTLTVRMLTSFPFEFVAYIQKASNDAGPYPT